MRAHHIFGDVDYIDSLFPCAMEYMDARPFRDSENSGDRRHSPLSSVCSPVDVVILRPLLGGSRVT
jgi:hypothetical protein